MIVACLAGAAALGALSLVADGVAGSQSIGLGIVALLFCSLTAAVRSIRRRPSLVAGPEGIRLPERSLSIPWEEVERVYVNVQAADRMLCVVPRHLERWLPTDPTGRDQAVQAVELFGAPFGVSLTEAAMADQEVMATLARLAAGRSLVG